MTDSAIGKTEVTTDQRLKEAMATLDSMNPELMFKVLVIGDYSAGKRSLLRKYVDDVFPADLFQSNIGLDFRTKIVENDGKVIKLQLWDTSSLARYRAVSSHYYRGLHGAILMFDVTDKRSFAGINHWLQDLDTNTDGHVAKVLVGNKIDLEHIRAVDYNTASEFAKGLGIPYLETSVKTGVNVDQAFKTLTADIKQRIDNGEIEPRLLTRPTVIKETKSWYIWPCVC